MANNLLISEGIPNPNLSLVFCKVISFDLYSKTVSAVSINDDSFCSFPNCQILCDLPQGYNFGTQYTPAFQADTETSYIHSPGDYYCVVAYSGGIKNPVVVGFLPPKQTEMSIPEFGLYLFRHESDVVSLIRADGTVELYHPSGSYLKIGETDVQMVSSDIEAEGLYPSKAKAFRVKDSARFNEISKMNLYLRFWNGQKITLNSEGSILIETDNSTINITKEGNLTINNSGSTTISSNSISVSADTIEVSSDDISITSTSQIDITAQDINVIADSANIEADNVDVSAKSINLIKT
jgi:hypothetical protein